MKCSELKKGIVFDVRSVAPEYLTPPIYGIPLEEMSAQPFTTHTHTRRTTCMVVSGLSPYITNYISISSSSSYIPSCPIIQSMNRSHTPNQFPSYPYSNPIPSPLHTQIQRISSTPPSYPQFSLPQPISFQFSFSPPLT